MAKKHGARSELVKGGFGTITYDGPPKGFPTASSIADAGFYGRQTAKTHSNRGLMNKTSLAIGMAFPEPDKDSFWEPFIKHNDFAEKATEEKRAERKARKAREKEFLSNLILSARSRVKRLGYDPKGFLGGLLVAIQAYEIIRERRTMLTVFTEYKPENQLQGIRRPPPLESRESTEDSLRKGIHGASKDAPRCKLFQIDGYR